VVDTDGVVGDDSFSWCCHSGVSNGGEGNAVKNSL
jgi:hypothetical protein